MWTWRGLYKVTDCGLDGHAAISCFHTSLPLLFISASLSPSVSYFVHLCEQVLDFTLLVLCCIFSRALNFINYFQWNPHVKCLWRLVDLDIKLMKILNAWNLALRLLTGDCCIWLLNVGKPSIEEHWMRVSLYLCA